ncbi:chorismate pyruvate-lyase family protein [Aurantivibrio infirmus]
MMPLAHNIKLSLFQRVLLHSDGTVTDLISTYLQSPIHVTKLKQEIIFSETLEHLKAPKDSELLARKILLTDTKNDHYLYAESIFVLDRMEKKFRVELLETETPIGLLWQQERTETFRELVDQRLEKQPSLQQYFKNAKDDQFLSRTYLVYQAGAPLGQITEKFPFSYFRES